jgi:bacillithiol synthase
MAAFSVAYQLPYSETKKFSKIVVDYLNEANALQPFYKHAPNYNGLANAIADRKAYATNRQALVDGLKQQYENNGINNKQDLIERLGSENCFTICTAHQPNIFTGYWYVIYKIAHAIAAAGDLKKQFPTCDFLPVFYLGSEDADIEELGAINFQNTAYNWQTQQTGAVGRMLVDEALIKIKDSLVQQLKHLPNSTALINLLHSSYKKESTIETATFKFIQEVFNHTDLLIFLPDHANWKRQFLDITKQEILQNNSLPIVEKLSQQLQDAGYKAQAHGRPINIFYLDNEQRTVIEKEADKYFIGKNKYTETALLEHLLNAPAAISPNVILRGVFQEMVLPNIAFIGGGGELAYWLQLKTLFEHYKVPYPVLLLRNSFAIVNQRNWEPLAKATMQAKDLFQSFLDLQNQMVQQEQLEHTNINTHRQQFENLYAAMQQQVLGVDPSLGQHVIKLKVQHGHKLNQLQLKLNRAARKKWLAKNNQIKVLYNILFPQNGLQERYDNFLLSYAKHGPTLINEIIKESETIAKHFKVLSGE